jgi:hypothetical protein
LATGLRRARDIDVKEASAYMHHKIHHGVSYDSEDSNDWDGNVWDIHMVEEYVKAKPGRCVVLVHGYVVDVTEYLGEHVCPIHFLRTRLVIDLIYSLAGQGYSATILRVSNKQMIRLINGEMLRGRLMVV